jgi:Peptidase family M23
MKILDSPFSKARLMLTCLMFSSTFLIAQRVIEIKYETDSRGAYVFSCYNNAYCIYILDLGFTTFKNLRSDLPLPFHGEVRPGYNKLFTVSAVDPQSATQFNYSSKYQKGCMHPVINSDFTYLLPISPGKEAQSYEMSPDKLPDTSSHSSPKPPMDQKKDSVSWYVLRLKMKAGDTIYAARKGVVTEIQDQSGANDAGQLNVSTENYIEIIHADCSFARYGILRKNSSLVKPGQAVKPGQPIGLVGGDPYGRGSDLRFSVYYYQEENTPGQNGGRHYIIPQIWTKKIGKGRLKHGMVYTSEFPAAVLDQELPKKSKTKKTNTQ